MSESANTESCRLLAREIVSLSLSLSRNVTLLSGRLIRRRNTSFMARYRVDIIIYNIIGGSSCELLDLSRAKKKFAQRDVL